SGVGDLERAIALPAEGHGEMRGSVIGIDLERPRERARAVRIRGVRLAANAADTGPDLGIVLVVRSRLLVGRERFGPLAVLFCSRTTEEGGIGVPIDERSSEGLRTDDAGDRRATAARARAEREREGPRGQGAKGPSRRTFSSLAHAFVSVLRA